MVMPLADQRQAAIAAEILIIQLMNSARLRLAYLLAPFVVVPQISLQHFVLLLQVLQRALKHSAYDEFWMNLHGKSVMRPQPRRMLTVQQKVRTLEVLAMHLHGELPSNLTGLPRRQVVGVSDKVCANRNQNNRGCSGATRWQ